MVWTQNSLQLCSVLGRWDVIHAIPKSGQIQSTQMTPNSTNFLCLDVWNGCPSCSHLYIVCAFVAFKGMTLIILSLWEEAYVSYWEEGLKGTIKSALVILINNLAYNPMCANNVICIEGTPSTSVIKRLCNCSNQRCWKLHSTAVAVISELCAKMWLITGYFDSNTGK